MTINGIDAGTFKKRFMRRYHLLYALALMPDEAFDWFVVACTTRMTGKAKIWPDAAGGFSDASVESIDDIRGAADVYLQSKGT